MTVALALVVAAVSIGSIHSLAPDHWVPFAALARGQRWSAGRTAAITALCGLGHVTSSVALGLLGVFFGRELFEAFGARLESIAGLLLIGCGIAYALWSVRRTRIGHGHMHAHVHGPVTAWTLFLLFSADPCVAVIPLMVASAPLGWASTLAVVAAYELATIGSMVVLVLPTRAAIGTVRGAWVDRWGDAVAGGVIVFVGVVVMRLGM
jgi:nickel/cobalt transporter (NicO) family protein